MSQTIAVFEPAISGVSESLQGRTIAERLVEVELPGRNDLLWYDALGDTLE